MQFDRLKRRGVLSPDLCELRLRTFRRGLKETDYVEGQNVKIEYRYRFMLLSLDLPRSLVRYCCGISFFAALAICSGIGGQVLAQASYDNSETPEGWAWARIKEGKAANFNERCGTPALDPRAEDETGWTNSCRRISATFLVDILTRAPWRNQVSFAGVNIIGTRIEGDIDFQNAKLDRSLMVEQAGAPPS